MFRATADDFRRMDQEGWTIDANQWLRPVYSANVFAGREDLIQFLYMQAEYRKSEWHKQILLSTPFMSAEQRMANEEGWQLSHRLDEIQRFRPKTPFLTDEEAKEHVHKRAIETSTLHQKVAVIIARTRMQGAKYGNSSH